MGNLFQAFNKAFKQQPDKVAFELNNGEQITYARFLQQIARIAGLIRRLNIAPGDCIAAQVEKSPDNIALYLACLQTGVVYLPLNTAYRITELEYFFNDARPAVIVCMPDRIAKIRNIDYQYDKPELLTLDSQGGGDLISSSVDFDADYTVTVRHDNDLAAILYTSGTTGRSKGAMLTHGNLLSNAKTLHAQWGWGADDVLLHALPVFHVHGLFVALHCAFLSAASILFLSDFDTRKVMAFLPRATVFMGVPTFYTRLLAEPGFSADCCCNVRLFILGSAPLHPETFAEFKQRTGHTILERYGMTEAGMITSNPLHGERRCGTVGPALPGVDVRIVNGEGDEVDAGKTGHLEVRGPNVFTGYWGMPEKTIEEFTRDGYFRTGDLASRDAEGYISITGRSRDMIISGGYNIYPKEVECVLDKMNGIVESAVFGVPHPDYGEVVVAAIVMENPAGEISQKKLIDGMKQQLASYKVPKRILPVKELPRNTMGKIQKNILRKQFDTTFE